VTLQVAFELAQSLDERLRNARAHAVVGGAEAGHGVGEGVGPASEAGQRFEVAAAARAARAQVELGGVRRRHDPSDSRELARGDHRASPKECDPPHTLSTRFTLFLFHGSAAPHASHTLSSRRALDGFTTRRDRALRER
jgi:hypothetical protein